MSRPRLIALLLALITLVVFLPVGSFSFVNFDDDDYITNNPPVRHGLTADGIRWAFTAFHASNWHPLTWLSHMTDCELFKLNAGAHHLVSVLFHAANAALLFVLLWRLTAKLWPAAFVAALFAWHPLHVESVAWVSERKDVLSTFFALLALLSYAKYVVQSKIQNPKSKIYYAASLLFFGLGLMAKPMLVTLPCVMLLLDFWPLGRIQNEKLKIKNLLPLLTEKASFFALTAVSCAITFIAQKNGEAVVSLAQVSLRYRLENAPVAAVGYLQKIFWPADLCAIYSMPEKIPALTVAASVALLVLVSVIAWRWRDARPYFLTGWLWFLGTLVPVIGLVQVGGQAMADRYTYIPSIGLFFALVFLAHEIAQRVRLPKLIAFGGIGLVSLACILVTENQMQYWRDGESLFRQAVAVNPRNDVALIDLGVALNAHGKPEEALAAYRQAEKIDSSRYQLHNNIGNILGTLGHPDEALTEYRAAIRLRPDREFLHSSAGIQLAVLGQFAEALAEFSTAQKLDATAATPRLEAAKVLFKLGRDAEGVEEFRAAVRLAPDDYPTLATVAHYLAANENAAARDEKNSLPLALKANELSGHRQPMVFDILGMALAANGDFTNAVTCAQNALDLATAAQLKRTEPIQTRLELYKKNLPWRESFRASNINTP